MFEETTPAHEPVDVTVIIVNYNTRDDTIACVASLLENVGDVRAQVVVVDNGSRDGSVRALRERFPTIDVVDAGANLGFSRGVNRGAAVARGEYLLLLNPDTTVLEGTLPALVHFARDNPQFRLFGGRTLRPDGRTEPSSCWGAPSLWSLTTFALLLSTAFKRSRVFDPESLGRWNRDTIREVPIITGCLLMLTASDFAALDGMDERYFLYGEDADFSMRAQSRGMARVIYPTATIVHAVGGSTPSGNKGAMVMAGKVTYLRTWWTPRRASLGVGLLTLGVGMRAALETVTRRRDRPWTTVWRRRADWSSGYPHAEAAIFGLGRPVVPASA